MSRYNTQLNTPGLNLRPRDTGSQLVSALGSVFSGTTAAASASARIQRAKDAEKARIRNEHNRIASSAFTQAERQKFAMQRQQEQVARDRVSDDIYNTLMDPRATNPEWLLQQGIAAVDNARTQQEEDQWQQFTLSQMSAVRRLRERETTQEAANEQRTFSRQLKRMVVEADVGVDFDALLRDPENMLSNLTDYYMTSLFTAAGDDIDDPDKRRLIADAAVDHAISRFSREGVPRIEQARQVTGEAMGYEMLENSREAYFDGSLEAQNFVTEMQGVISRQFSNRTAQGQAALARQMAGQSIEALAQLPNDMTAGQASDRMEALIKALPPGTFSFAEKETFRRKFYESSLPKTVSSRITQLVETTRRQFETQTTINGTPRTPEEAQMDMIQVAPGSDKDIYGLIEDRVISELGLDINNEEHAFAFNQARQQIDRGRESAIRLMTNMHRGKADRLSLLSGAITTTNDASNGFAATSFGSGKWVKEDVDILREAVIGADMDPTDMGLVEGEPIDFNRLFERPEGEEVINLVIQQFTDAWNHNSLAPIPAGMKTRIEGLLSQSGEGQEGNQHALSALMIKLSPSHKANLYDKMDRVNKGRLIGLEYGTVFGLSDTEIEQAFNVPDQLIADAATNLAILSNTDANYLESSKRRALVIVEGISEAAFSTVENAQHFLVNNPMSEFFFQQVEIRARAIAQNQDGTNIPNDSHYKQAGLSVFTRMKEDGLSLMTFHNEDGNAFDQFVVDPNRHAPEGTQIANLWQQQRENASEEDPSFKGLMNAVGLTRETLPAGEEDDYSKLARAMYLQDVQDQRSQGIISPEQATILAQGGLQGGTIYWRPMTPSHPYFRRAMLDKGGGVPMIPFFKKERESDGLQYEDPLFGVNDFETWPFMASVNAITGFRKGPSTEEATQDFLESAIRGVIPRPIEDPSELQGAANSFRDRINETVTLPLQERGEKVRQLGVQFTEFLMGYFSEEQD